MLGRFFKAEFSHLIVSCSYNKQKNCGFLRMEVGRKLFSSLIFFPLEHLWYFIYSHSLPYDQTTFVVVVYLDL